MWHHRKKRSKIQLIIWIGFLYQFSVQVFCSELFIDIPLGDVRGDAGRYRLDYSPPQGNPRPNTTFSPLEVARGLKLTHTMPGMRYNFMLYYSNATLDDVATWTASISTVPTPPQNLNVSLPKKDVAVVKWDPPNSGYSQFKLRVIPLSEPQKRSSIQNFSVKELSTPLFNLTPGASYELQLYTIFDQKQSDSFISLNFTTRPYAPGRFIVWYRNETTMLVLWQPPYPPGIYSHYRVSIDPPDAVESVLNVEEDDPPGPAQAAFHGLVPGRAYNITVETVSQDKVSEATTQEYHTIPPPPRNVTFDRRSLSSDSFVVRWEAPKAWGEFDRYQLSLGVRKQSPIIVDATAPREAEFSSGIEPGRTYTVLVKTVAVNVASWPTSGNVTTRPLPVTNLILWENSTSSLVELRWRPDPASLQDKYRVIYQEVESLSGNSHTLVRETNSTTMSKELYPGRNYTVEVYAVSNGVESRAERRYFLTKPASPIFDDPQLTPGGLNISWKSDVKSRQDKYSIEITRNDTGDVTAMETTLNYASFTNLYPGAGFQLKIYAISNGLWSKPHVDFQAVYPNPVRNLTILKSTNTTVELNWEPPVASLFDAYIVRYKPFQSSQYQQLAPVNQSQALVRGLLPGEKYQFTVVAVSFKVESMAPAQVTHIVPPNPVRAVVPVLDARNITLEWPRPDGRIDDYTVIWWQYGELDKKASKKISGSQATEGISRKVSVLIGDLQPGELYIFDIYTTANDLNSDMLRLETRTMPIITSQMIITSSDQAPSITITYTKTPHTVATFDAYRFRLSDPNISIKEKDARDTSRKIVFADLVPGRLYNVTAWTVSENITSQPLHRQYRLNPEPVQNINASFLNDSAIKLTWDLPAGEYDSFEIQYLNAERDLITNYASHGGDITIDGLRANHRYTFTVLTIAGDESNSLRRSNPVSANFTTSESVPGQVQEFVPIQVFPNRINFRWSIAPEQKNGVLHGYIITYHDKNYRYVMTKNFTSADRSGNITGLTPGQHYVFQIQAWNNKGRGPAKVREQTMPIDAPPQPSHNVFPTERGTTSNTITIRYRKNYFSEQNGEVIAYSVIVAEDPTYDSPGLEVLSWRDVQAFNTWPPYQATEPYYPFNSTKMEDFVIGSEKDCPSHKEYCNGPLKPGSTYRVKIRAYTSFNKFADTQYSHTIVTDFEGSNIGLAVAIPVLVLLFLVVVIVIVIKRRHSGPFIKRAAETNPRDEVHSISDSIIETSRPVELRKFVEHYRHMSADSDYHFTEEYEALKNVGRNLPCTAADLPVNRPKNRFTNILPYDHSRFILQATDDEEGSDYINANYVSGFNSPREFIVTQGPLASTRDDYWRMCWESNSRAIIMLTRCIERGREKCDHYWPYDTQPLYYGDIEVTMLNESHFPDWNITEFRVCKGDQSRIIRHFHFTTWPDFGVPDPPQTLVRFVRAFRERVPPDHRPIVVHCSAGVGRSGTFIALDRILQSIRVSDYVDIFGIVYEMRRERTCMVQNEQQYICIHQCLMVVRQGLENMGMAGRTMEMHSNRAFEDDEGIAESGM